MPEWTDKDERMYEAIRDTAVEEGKSARQAKEIAARTVNKHRREAGRTARKTTRGTGNPNARLEDRTVQELRNRARQLDITGRSSMRKHELIDAIRERN